MLEPRYRWRLRDRVRPSPELVEAATAAGLGRAATALVAARGFDAADLRAATGPAEAGLHDPRTLPDADRLLERLGQARRRAERVLVFGDFDADGLTGLAILVETLRHLGISVEPYVPSRLDEGHGLSQAAVDLAAATGVTVIVTVDTGSSSRAEVAAAADRGIDVLITDHHRVPDEWPAALALVNPHRPDATYPDRRLSGAGVAFKVAQLLLALEPGGPDRALALTDLATIGSVSDLAPIVGENRAIARLGLERLRTDPRAGIAALLARAGQQAGAIDLETVGFTIAPRLNAAGRVGEAMDAARLLLAHDPAEATELAERLEAANLTRRDLTKQAVSEAREAVTTGAPASVVRGPWPVGIVGLVASRLVEDTGLPAVVGADLGDVVRASCRSLPGVDLAAVLESCADLLDRHGGHAGAAGFEIRTERWRAFETRFVDAVAAAVDPDPRPGLDVDLALPARFVDYPLARDLARLAPYGPGNPDPLVAVLGLTVARVRAANGGHTQLVLRRDPDVLDGIAFGRDDLVDRLAEGDRVDVVARLASRTFGGYESLQLDVRDVAPSGGLDVAHAAPEPQIAPDAQVAAAASASGAEVG